MNAVQTWVVCGKTEGWRSQRGKGVEGRGVQRKGWNGEQGRGGKLEGGREGAQPGEGAVDGLGGIYEHSPSLNTPFTEKQSIVC